MSPHGSWRSLPLGLLLALALLTPTTARAFAWQYPLGSIDVTNADDGSGALAGMTSFGLWYAHAWPCGEGCSVEIVSPGEARYAFDADHALGDLIVDDVGPAHGPVVRTRSSGFRIVDDGLVDQDLVDWAAPFGLVLTVGEEIDLLEFHGEATGASPAETVEWTIRAIYRTTDPQSGIDGYSTSNWAGYPSSPSSPDLLAVEVREGGGIVFAAQGEVFAVPEVGFGAGLVGGAGFLFIAARTIRSTSAVPT